jgi:hypothetical protein
MPVCTALKHGAAIAALSLFALPALALPQSTLTLLQPSGTTNGTSPVQIWVTLGVDASATVPLALDGTTTSFDNNELAEFASISQVQHTVWASCSTSFWPQPPLGACFDAASAWKFEFNNDPPSLMLETGSLAPGETRVYLFGSFVPQNGAVAPGIYRSSNFGFEFIVQGMDQAGAPLTRYFAIANTCDSGDAACTFTREVIAVPEPATYASMALGLAVIGGFVARRRKAVAAA